MDFCSGEWLSGEQHCRICGQAAWELPPNLEQMDASIT